MKRTVLLVASVVVAAVGTGVVALWAVSTANSGTGAVAATVATVKAAATPSVAPTTPGRGEEALSVAIDHPGLVPGQWFDLAVVGADGNAALFATHVPVLALMPDGRVRIALPTPDAVKLLGQIRTGGTLTALLPGPSSSTLTATPTPTGSTAGSPSQSADVTDDTTGASGSASPGPSSSTG